MSDHPGLLLGNFSEDELHTRASDLQGKIAWMSQYSAGNHAVTQLTSMLNAINGELATRAGSRQFAHMAKASPVVIETDPDLRDRDRQQQDRNQPSPVAEPRPRRTKPMRTARPVSPQPEVTLSPDKES